MIQFCDRNADDSPSFLEGPSAFEDDDFTDRARKLALNSRPLGRESSRGARWALRPTTGRVATNGTLMDPIKLLEDHGIAPGASTSVKTVKTAEVGPPPRVWDSIEATLRGDGLIA